MRGCNDERLKSLCEQVQLEQDPTRLMELIQEINRILGEGDSGDVANEVPGATPSRVDAA